MKACEIILNRGYGTATATPEADEIISQFIDGDITAIRAGLLLESKGFKVGNMLHRFIINEIMINNASKPMLGYYPMATS